MRIRQIDLRVPGAPDGAFCLAVAGEELPARSCGIADYAGKYGHPEAARARKVSVVSRPIGGEVRGYMLVGSTAGLAYPARPLVWPEVDSAVAEALGVTVRAGIGAPGDP